MNRCYYECVYISWTDAPAGSHTDDLGALLLVILVQFEFRTWLFLLIIPLIFILSSVVSNSCLLSLQLFILQPPIASIDIGAIDAIVKATGMTPIVHHLRANRIFLHLLLAEVDLISLLCLHDNTREIIIISDYSIGSLCLWLWLYKVISWMKSKKSNDFQEFYEEFKGKQEQEVKEGRKEEIFG